MDKPAQVQALGFGLIEAFGLPVLEGAAWGSGRRGLQGPRRRACRARTACLSRLDGAAAAEPSGRRRCLLLQMRWA